MCLQKLEKSLERSIVHCRSPPPLQSSTFFSLSEKQSVLLTFIRLRLSTREVHNPPVIDYYLSSFNTSSDVEIIGSSKGLLCDYYISSHRFLVWNPAIEEVREVPRGTISFERPLSIGLGFSSIANGYKIIKIRRSYGIYKLGVNKGEVYSLGTGFWKDVELGNIKDIDIYSEAASDDNGTIIWLAGNLNDDMIISFDIAMEGFTFIPTPALHPSSTSIPTFYENKPAIISYNKKIPTSKSDGFIHLWVVEEDTCASGGGRWTWTKIHSGRRYLHPYYLTPLNIWRNETVCTFGFLSEIVWRAKKYGEALENEGRTLCLLNLTTDEFKKFLWWIIFVALES